METIAVYWEPVVRIYGFDIKSNVSLLHIKCDGLTTDKLLQDLEQQQDDPASAFLFTQMQMQTPDLFHIQIAASPETIKTYRASVEKKVTGTSGLMISVHHPVELLYFHGPHFQDRYGIASNVFKTLEGITIYSIGCTGTSIFVVTGDGQAELAREQLTQTFSVPIN